MGERSVEKPALVRYDIICYRHQFGMLVSLYQTTENAETGTEKRHPKAENDQVGL